MNLRFQHPIVIIQTNNLYWHYAACTARRERVLNWTRSAWLFKSSPNVFSAPSRLNVFSKIPLNALSQAGHMQGVLPRSSACVIVISLARLVLGVAVHLSKWYATPEGYTKTFSLPINFRSDHHTPRRKPHQNVIARIMIVIININAFATVRIVLGSISKYLWFYH